MKVKGEGRAFLLYPKKEEVAELSHLEVCKYYRFLPSPMKAEEDEVMGLLMKKFREGGGMTSEISKLIGW